MTTISTPPCRPRHAAAPPAACTSAWRRVASVSPGTLGVAAATGLVLFEALDALIGSRGLGTTLAAGWAQLVAPGFVALVLAAVACERLWPAERRPFLARGHVQDAVYFVLYVAGHRARS